MITKRGLGSSSAAAALSAPASDLKGSRCRCSVLISLFDWYRDTAPWDVVPWCPQSNALSPMDAVNMTWCAVHFELGAVAASIAQSALQQHRQAAAPTGRGGTRGAYPHTTGVWIGLALRHWAAASKAHLVRATPMLSVELGWVISRCPHCRQTASTLPSLLLRGWGRHGRLGAKWSEVDAACCDPLERPGRRCAVWTGRTELEAAH